MNRELPDIKEELERLGQTLNMGSPSTDPIHNIKELEENKKKILHVQDITWRLKRKALWIQEGNKNTKLFHRYVNNRRMVNTIWDIKDSNGYMVKVLLEIQWVRPYFLKILTKREMLVALKTISWGLTHILQFFMRINMKNYTRFSTWRRFIWSLNHLLMKNSVV